MQKKALLHGYGLVLFLLTLCLPLPLHPEETIRHFFASSRPDQDIEDLLYLAIGIELTRAGFTSTLTSDDAAYRLETGYENRRDTVALMMRLSATERPETALAETDHLLLLDSTLDGAIADAVRKLLAQTDLNRGLTEGAEIEGLLSKPAAVPDALPAANAAVPAALPAVTEKKGIATPYIDTYIAAGGVALFGPATDYFHYGALGVFGAGYAIPLGNLALTPGIRVSATRIFNNAGVTGNPLYLSTIGANLQLGTANNVPYRASVVASGGAAVLSITSAGKLLSKSVPYADFGVHSGIPLGGGFFMGGEIRFIMVFDKDIFLMGAVPVFALNKEF